MKNINIGKIGDINQINGVEIYAFEKEICGKVKIYNFDFLYDLQKEVFDILPDGYDLNFENCVVGLGLFVNNNYRKQGIGTKLLHESFIESKKYNVKYWLGYRKIENQISKKIFDKLGAKVISTNKNIEVVLVNL